MTKSMLDAAAKALAQMFTPALRAVLLKAVGLALILIVIVGIVLQRFLSALTEHGATWAEQSSGFAPHAADRRARPPDVRVGNGRPAARAREAADLHLP